MTDELFTTKMKRATRKAHAVSDALVNTKLVLALNSDRVWAEGLIIFYEIFKFLERAMKERSKENLGQLCIQEAMNRTDAFEKDLAFYLGPDWNKDYKPRESVDNYLNHLGSLLENDSDLLMAYVYHLYMGLLSGGQILQKKREVQRKVLGSVEDSGRAVTLFEGIQIRDLKNQLRDKMNMIAENLNDNKRQLLIDESIKVFELNNSIIKSVQGAEKVAIKNVFHIFSCTTVILGIIYYIYRKQCMLI